MSSKSDEESPFEEEVKLSAKPKKSGMTSKKNLVKMSSKSDEESPFDEEEVKVPTKPKKSGTVIRKNLVKRFPPKPVYEEGVVYGLAFCHRSDHRNVSVMFPEITTPVQWTYLDVEGISSPNQIIGSMYEPSTLRAAALKNRGYDYVVMPNCPTGLDDEILLYTLTAPLIAASCLLRPGGKIIVNNFMTFATRYFDVAGEEELKEVKRQLKMDNLAPAIEYLNRETKRKIVMTGDLEVDRTLLQRNLSRGHGSRLHRLSDDNDMLTHIEYMLDNIRFLANYESWHRYHDGGKHHVLFIKGGLEEQTTVHV